MTAKKRKSNNPEDEKMSLTKGQLLNICEAAAGKRGACKKAKDFVKHLKAEIRQAKK